MPSPQSPSPARCHVRDVARSISKYVSVLMSKIEQPAGID